VADIRLCNIDGPEAEEFVEFAAVGETLTAGKWDPGLRRAARYGKSIARL
jgi:hypothetical protein